MVQGRHMVLLLIIHMMLPWRVFRITKSWRSSLKNNFLHKLKYRVQLNIPTYLLKLLCFISFDNSKLLCAWVLENHRLDWWLHRNSRASNSLTCWGGAWGIALAIYYIPIPPRPYACLLYLNFWHRSNPILTHLLKQDPNQLKGYQQNTLGASRSRHAAH